MSAVHERPMLVVMADRRLICDECGVKWFMPSHRPLPDAPLECASCGGALVALPLPVEDRPPGWSATEHGHRTL
jgi:hypothetical protein